MAGDLKDFLKKVLASKGEKKFFFAYGAGKRKDKKGEGELAVRGKKPKKADVEAELLDAGDVFEGVCWIGNRPENSETVYFQARGKKLSTALVTKMIKTAKTTTGRQYDFQIPSAEEEARAAKLPEGEEDTGPAGVLPPAPPPGAAAPPPPPPGGAAVLKRLNAMSANIKAALGGPAAARVQSLLVGVNGLIKNKDFVQAWKALDELESLLTQVQTAPPPPPAGRTEPKPAGADLGQKWRERFAELEPRYQEVLKTQPANAGALRAAMDFANASAEKGDFAKALAALTRLEALLEAARTLGKETDVIPEGIVKQRVEQLEKAAQRWHEVHFQSIEGLESLMQQLRADDDPDLHEIANRVDVLTKEIPGEIEASLAKLSAAVRAADAGETAKWVNQVQLGVRKCEGFLQDNLPDIERCEENPFDVPVMIQRPLRETLANIRASLPKL
jgi:hypothetical protein